MPHVPSGAQDRPQPIVMDGRKLARERAPGLAARAAAVTARRGRAPRLGVVAFAAGGIPPRYIPRKLRACEAAGLEVDARILPSDAETGAAVKTMAELVRSGVDAIFLEFPFPDGIDVEALMAAVPEELDVDVMTADRIRGYMDAAEGPAPLTVAAALALLDGFEVEVRGLDGVVVTEASPFAEMFSEALVRRGARMRPLVSPDAASPAVHDAQLIVSIAGQPRLLDAGELAPGAVVIDAGYFNPGGVGDVDCSEGTGHLAALAPVPGAIGPMTVSMLVERVIAFAER